VRSARQAVPEDSPFKAAERAGSEVISASLDLYRDLRDACSEAQFFTTFGVMFPLLHPGRDKPERPEAAAPVAPRRQPVVREALAAIQEGGYAEALARAACLLSRKGEPLPLARFELKADLEREYRDMLPALPAKQWKDIRGRQQIICRYDRDRAVQTLPALLASGEDRQRFLTLLESLLADPRVSDGRSTAAQRAMLERIREVLPATKAPPQRLVGARRKAAGGR
jgi:hypothetical protein